MIKKYTTILAVIFLISCGGVKRTQEALNSGDYDNAINRSIKQLRDNKTKRGHQDFVYLLEEAFEKKVERELQQINFWKKDGNPAHLEKIYETYVGLNKVQERIKPLLPLPVYAEDRNARFNFKNYDVPILTSKDKLSDFLYQNATAILENAQTKLDYRKAYDDLKYLSEINPGYGNLNGKMEEAYQKGLSFVKVAVTNATDKVIPARLEAELLDFNAFGINDLWTEYHTNPLEDIVYDYEMQLDFQQINISPERVNETQLIKEKLIKDGFEYVLDANGNVAKDSLGNDIKVDKMRKVRCNFYRFAQIKTADVGAKVRFLDLQNGQVLNAYPINTQFIFEHMYANVDGDRRALDNDLVALLDLAAVPFPTDEQMVYNAGEDIKNKLKGILSRNRFD